MKEVSSKEYKIALNWASRRFGDPVEIIDREFSRRPDELVQIRKDCGKSKAYQILSAAQAVQTLVCIGILLQSRFQNAPNALTGYVCGSLASLMFILQSANLLSDAKSIYKSVLPTLDPE